MPNIKSSEKSVRTDKKRNLRNVSVKSTLKTFRTKVLKSKNKEEADQNLKTFISLYDKASSKGIIHKNTAARKISRLTKRVNAMES